MKNLETQYRELQDAYRAVSKSNAELVKQRDQANIRAQNAEASARALTKDLHDWEKSFEVYNEAEMRGIRLWQAENGDRVWPDKAKLVLFLMNQLDRMERLYEVQAAVLDSLTSGEGALEKRVMEWHRRKFPEHTGPQFKLDKLAEEVAEVYNSTEAYVNDPKAETRHHLVEELADVGIVLTAMAGLMGISLHHAMKRKFQKVLEKYPVTLTKEAGE